MGPADRGRRRSRPRPDENLPVVWRLAAMTSWLQAAGESGIAARVRADWLAGRLPAADALETLELYAAVAGLRGPDQAQQR